MPVLRISQAQAALALTISEARPPTPVSLARNGKDVYLLRLSGMATFFASEHLTSFDPLQVLIYIPVDL